MTANWRDLAACIGTDQTIWFPEAEESAIAYRQARKICERCPVITECLDDAIATDELYHGFRGGMKPKERRRYAQRGQQTWHQIIHIMLNTGKGNDGPVHETAQIDLD